MGPRYEPPFVLTPSVGLAESYECRPYLVRTNSFDPHGPSVRTAVRTDALGGVRRIVRMSSVPRANEFVRPPRALGTNGHSYRRLGWGSPGWGSPGWGSPGWDSPNRTTVIRTPCERIRSTPTCPRYERPFVPTARVGPPGCRANEFVRPPRALGTNHRTHARTHARTHVRTYARSSYCTSARASSGSRRFSVAVVVVLAVSCLAGGVVPVRKPDTRS